jgi:hypothetical protein
MNNQLLLDNLRCIPDWPIKGVNFRDVSTLFKNPASLKEISDEMYELYLFMEVGRYSSLQIFRLSHIYNLMIFVVILVASWLLRHT